MNIVNPATDEVIERIEPDTDELIVRKLAGCREAQLAWGSKPIAERITCIERFSGLIHENMHRLAALMTSETGKPINQSINELNGAVGKNSFFVQQSERLLQQDHVNVDGNTEEIIDYDPLGVIANISAWNYPWLVGINIFVPALICGNGVFYKPSEFATLTGIAIGNLLWQAGVPKDVFHVIVGDGSVGAQLLSMDFDGYFFTGSYATGKKINGEVAHKLVPVGLELGGKDPAYVRADVPSVKAAAVSIGDGALYNNGQSCCSVERIYVDEKIHDEFVEHLTEFASSQKTGDPTSPDTDQGAITRKTHLVFLKEQVDDAIANGARLLTGGRIVEGRGSFFEATVLTDVTHDMLVMREETFGPIASVMKVKGDEEALRLMNDTDYGLTAAIYTGDEKLGRELLRCVNSGTGYLNCCDRVSAFLPWSGRGHSGLGSTLSQHGLFAFCQPKGLHLRKS
ncbi:MAG: aldehyde dehydrogenase family protein [Verrucomicrobiales bacterium]